MLKQNETKTLVLFGVKGCRMCFMLIDFIATKSRTSDGQTPVPAGNYGKLI